MVDGDEVARAAREALTAFADDPYALYKIRAYDAWQSSDRFVDDWRAHDPAARIFYVDRYLPVSKTTLLAVPLVLAAMIARRSEMNARTYIAGVPVTMSPVNEEDFGMSIPRHPEYSPDNHPQSGMDSQ